MGKPALSDELPVGLVSYHRFRHPHSQKTFYSPMAEWLSIDSNADLTSFSPPSPTTYKKEKNKKPKKNSPSHMFPEMAQTHEEGAKDREQPFRKRPDGGTGLRQGKLNMKKAVKQRRERVDECKPLAGLQAGKGH